jgi:hypothetical protein
LPVRFFLGHGSDYAAVRENNEVRS